MAISSNDAQEYRLPLGTFKGQWQSVLISSNDVQECRLPLDTIEGPPIRIGGERDCKAETVSGDRPAIVTRAARGDLA
jgi:hypothetical protein